MALQSNTTIIIKRQEFSSFQSLNLHQEIDASHLLTLTFRMDTLEDLEEELATNSKEFLGETISLQTIPANGFEDRYGELTFKGIITEIKIIKGHEVSDGDKVVIVAKSPDFLTNDGPHFASYNDVSLSEIIDSSFEGYDTSKLEVDIRPQNNPSLHYSVQHNESAFTYVSRLAAQYGEWFYYDGAKLVFGMPGTEDLELTYGFDLVEYQIRLMPQSNNYKIFANDYLTDEVQEKSTSEINAGLRGFGGFVSEKSNAIYRKETKIWHNLYSDTEVQQRLDTAVELQKKAIDVKQVKVQGVCDNPGVKIGSVVVIDGNRYRIIEVTHSNNEIGDYTNNFEGITADINAYPYTNINAFPKSETQVATVKENADPDGLGRIRVQFPWQVEYSELTPWVRIVTPHGGANKGFHFIPEIEEKVLVGFEGGNAEHPYILGSLYTGNAKPEAFKTDTNDVKIIRTRSGHTIELNDKDGEEKIHIYDNEGSIITFDTQAKSLYIQATENIEFQAKNIKLKASENIELNADQEIKIAATGNALLASEAVINIQAESDVNVSASSNITIEATSNANFKGQSVIVEGQTSAEFNSAQTKITGSGMIDVSGGMIKIN